MVITDILTKFNRKKKAWLSPKHPLFLMDIEQKKIYCAGIFAQAALNKSASTLNNFELERLMVRGLGLEPKDIAQVIRLATEEHRLTDSILFCVKDDLMKYLYLMDLINISLRKDEITNEEREAINRYVVLFKLPTSNLQLIWSFVQSAYENNLDDCIRVFAKMREASLPLTMTELKYYMPDMEYVTEIVNKSVQIGKETRIVDACTIKEKLIVPKDSTLILDHANIYLYGTIIVDGGTLIIRDTVINNKCENSTSLIEVKSFSDVQIENSVLDCRYSGSAINQKNGNLRVKNTKFYHTTKSSALKFWGKQLEISACSFHRCFTTENGAAIQIQQAQGSISNCTFSDCEAKNGGAIYANAIVMITCCSFKNCYALEHGGAIFYNDEIKSNILDCQYIECFPEGEEIIQYLHDKAEKVIDKEYSIRVATIIDLPIRVTELGILCFDHVVVYIRKAIQCKGILEIKSSKIIADNLLERDMFDITRSRGCVVDSSEFDGRATNSVFQATGSRIVIIHSIFRNIKNGRAIYDAMEPKITDTIFSYCQDGAIYSNAGLIKNCMFINCRQKSGAGILMYGSRGQITDCQFIRCISEYSGGAIDKSGGHQITGCKFKECKPNNIS